MKLQNIVIAASLLIVATTVVDGQANGAFDFSLSSSKNEKEQQKNNKNTKNEETCEKLKSQKTKFTNKLNNIEKKSARKSKADPNFHCDVHNETGGNGYLYSDLTKKDEIPHSGNYCKVGEPCPKSNEQCINGKCYVNHNPSDPLKVTLGAVFPSNEYTWTDTSCSETSECLPDHTCASVYGGGVCVSISFNSEISESCQYQEKSGFVFPSGNSLPTCCQIAALQPYNNCT